MDLDQAKDALEEAMEAFAGTPLEKAEFEQKKFWLDTCIYTIYRWGQPFP